MEENANFAINKTNIYVVNMLLLTLNSTSQVWNILTITFLINRLDLVQTWGNNADFSREKWNKLEYGRSRHLYKDLLENVKITIRWIRLILFDV